MDDVVTEYCLLGLRFDRLVEGFVDAFTGDPELKRRVDDEPTPDPIALAKSAARLRGDLASAGLDDGRRVYLEAQLRALEASGRSLAGEPMGFVDEVEAYFEVRPTMGDQDGYAAAHEALDVLLPGAGSLRERYLAFRSADEIPPARLGDTMHALSSALRDRVRATFGLPEQETVTYDVVTDQPWSGFNYYLGDYHSRVAVNADLPMRLSDLPHLVAHESYPGHHTERCHKEQLLVEGKRWAEQTIMLVNTPECLMAEGLADLGLQVAVGRGWGAWAQEVYADLGLRFDGDHAEAISRARAPLGLVNQDAALLLHDRGASQDEVVAYICRWALVPEDRARKSLQFLTSPLWRAYTSTYAEGYRLLGAWLDGGDEQAKFLRLLDEPLTPSAIATELAAT
ncbi:MAG TPA: DUF885 domain-containing protein [Mycobacteriales bacterium]|nr:DUF885 domain-containing protein [Mycobacteriales bacterium]